MEYRLMTNKHFFFFHRNSIGNNRRDKIFFIESSRIKVFI